MAALPTLAPPAADAPIADDGKQHSDAWSGFFQDVAQQLKALPGVVRAGVVDGSDAAAGNIGQLISQVNGVPVACAAGATVNAAQITLTPGDWDVRAECWINIGGTATSLAAGISIASAALTALAANTAQVSQVWSHTAGLQSIAVGPCRMSLTVATPIYLVGRITGVAGTCYGKLEARRVR